MTNSNDISLVAGAIGGLALLSIIDNLTAPKIRVEEKKSQNTIPGYDAVGPIYFDQEMDGFIAPF